MESYNLMLNKDTILSSSCSSSTSTNSSYFLNSTAKFTGLGTKKSTRLFANMLPMNSFVLKATKKQKKQTFSIFKAKFLKGAFFKKSSTKKIVISVSKVEKKKKEDKQIVSAIYKLMDKSLGWFGKKSKKSSKKYSTKSQTSLSYTMSQDASYLSSSFTSISNQIIENEISNLNEKFYFQQSSYLLSAPSMCSSFDATKSKLNSNLSEDKYHSTPRSLYQQFSPIKSPNSVFDLSTSTSCVSGSSSVLSMTPNMSRRRLSFGVTSSPVYLNENICDEVLEDQSMIDSRLLEHLNEIKRNIRIDVESREKSGNFKRSCNQIESESVEDLSLKNSKKRKLQQMFQTKLKKQLDDIKKWQYEYEQDVYSGKSKQGISSRRNIAHSTKIRCRNEFEMQRYNNCNCNSFSQPIGQCQCFRCFNMIRGMQFQHRDYFYNNYYNCQNNFGLYAHNSNEFMFNNNRQFETLYKNNCCMSRNHY